MMEVPTRVGLLDLPVEVRVLVYNSVFAGTQINLRFFRIRSTYCAGHEHGATEAAQPTILLVSKQVLYEARPVLFASLRLIFHLQIFKCNSIASVLNNMLDRTTVPWLLLRDALPFIKHIQLSTRFRQPGHLDLVAFPNLQSVEYCQCRAIDTEGFFTSGWRLMLDDTSEQSILDLFDEAWTHRCTGIIELLAQSNRCFDVLASLRLRFPGNETTELCKKPFLDIFLVCWPYAGICQSSVTDVQNRM